MTPSPVFTQPAHLPVLRSADILVVGGSLAGIAAALKCAGAGRRTVLIEPRTYLGREVTATLRPWVPVRAADVPLWAGLLPRIEVGAAGDGMLQLKLDQVKRGLEDLLLEAGVDLLYASQAAGVCQGNRVEAAIIANKSGRQVIRAPVVVDASETAVVARLAGASFESMREVRYSRTLEFDGVSALDVRSLPVPLDLGIARNTVRFHPGYRGPRHVFVEYDLAVPFRDGPEGSMQREIAARHMGMALAQHLVAEVPAFASALLATSSYELYGPQTPCLAGPPPAWAQTTHLPGFAGPLPGLWCLSEAARLGEPAVIRDPVGAAELGDALGAALVEDMPESPADVRREEPVVVSHREAPSDGLTIRELEGPQRGRAYLRHPVAAQTIPILTEAEVLVAGGGTSGATAAAVAGREGARTVLVEMNPGLGGTGTIGGVNSYWYGRHEGFSARVERATDEMQRSIGQSKANWNIEAKMEALLREAEAGDVEVFFGCRIWGAVMEGNRVRGAVVATAWGPRAVLADVVIDATGDGDVAAAAGAAFEYGSGLDRSVMWFSLAQFATPGRTRNNFTSTVDISNVEDYTRAILAGRRRGEVHEHGVYPAPRESRHILGDVVLTHTDQLRLRHWPDVVNVHYSNHDIKGISTSPWVRMGLIPPNLEIEVPYRALLPRGLDGILVVGKAISATHDALPAIRMQADLENLGGVAGLAAAQAVRSGQTPRQIDVGALQGRLVADGLLPPDMRVHADLKDEYTTPELEDLVSSLTGESSLHEYSNMEMGERFQGRIPIVDICTAGPRIVPYLERALAESTGLRRIQLAQVLAFYHSPAALPVLTEEIERSLSGGSLPARDNAIRHAGYPPDQGAMPDTVYLLYSLGTLCDRNTLPLWERVAALLEPTEDSIRDRRTGIFYYVEAICWAMEHLADPAAIPLLKRLHAFPALRDQVSRAGFQADFFQERQAMLELMLGRALARCGSREGFEILIAYLDDVRALLAEQAHAHLVDITGRDHGKDAAGWRHDLAARTTPKGKEAPRAPDRDLH